MRGQSRSIPVKDAGGSLLDRYLDLKLALPGMVISNVAVAFCDQVYRGAIGIRGQDTAQEEQETFWAADKIRTWVQKTKKNSVFVSSKDWRERSSLKMSLENYFDPFSVPDRIRKYMIMNKISILVEDKPQYIGQEPYFRINPVGLKQMGFAKALDPYSAFQNLSMWIGGVLGGTSPETVEITNDQVLIANHGYDKYSFRSQERPK